MGGEGGFIDLYNIIIVYKLQCGCLFFPVGIFGNFLKNRIGAKCLTRLSYKKVDSNQALIASSFYGK